MAEDRPLLAVLIDGDNASHKDARVIFEEIASLGEVAVKRIYGDSADKHLAGWRKILNTYAISPHDSPAYSNGKNSSDLALAIDAMDLLHAGRFDGFVLVSSDSDFTRLASRIREQGLDVFGIGNKKTNEAFRNACKRFIYVENLGEEEVTTKNVRATGKADASKEPPSKVVPMVRAAMRKIDPEGVSYSLGQIGQYLLNANPDFDPRNYGSAKLSELLAKTGQFEVVKVGNHLEVRRPD